MRRFLTLAFCGLLAAIATLARADEPDPIRAKLDAAVKNFGAEQTKFKEGVVSHFDAREEAAVKAGNKKLLDELKLERKRFEEKGELPRSAPAALRQKMLAAIVANEAGHELAIKEYTMARKNDQATAVEKELNAFKRQIARFESKLDLFQIDTVWKGSHVWVVGKDSGKGSLQIQVVERDGKSFKVALTYGNGTQAEGTGTIERGKLEWKRTVQNVQKKTEYAIDFTGVIKEDKLYWESVDRSNAGTTKGVMALEKKK